MSDQPGSFFTQLQACKQREADLRKVRDGLRERVMELERELADLRADLELAADTEYMKELHALTQRLQKRIAELESKITSLQATAEADAKVNAQLHDELRAKKIDVNSAALTDANRRIEELEHETRTNAYCPICHREHFTLLADKRCQHCADLERIAELERERDEAVQRHEQLQREVESAIASLVKERDEARGIAEDMNRRVSWRPAGTPPATLPWEEGE